MRIGLLQNCSTPFAKASIFPVFTFQVAHCPPLYYNIHHSTARQAAEDKKTLKNENSLFSLAKAAAAASYTR